LLFLHAFSGRFLRALQAPPNEIDMLLRRRDAAARLLLEGVEDMVASGKVTV
jgi:hypothetical protein